MGSKGVILAAVLILACEVASAQTISRAEYIDRYKSLAVSDMERYGIPASIKMAQAILESNNGNSRLAREGNNHFGIKCKSTWKGESLNHTDDAPNECFRKYPTAEASFRDHSEFLDTSPRYEGLFSLDPTDYKAWAHGLRKAGYATNPRYPELLIKIIEDNRLYLLDQGVDIHPRAAEMVDNGGGASADTELISEGIIDLDNYVVAMYNNNGYAIYGNNGAKFIVTVGGDDMAKIARLFSISEKRLRRFNDIPSGKEPASESMIYITPKSRRSENGHVMHVVREGETLHSVSQLYGIKLKSLARLNRLDKGAKLNEGQQINLI